MCRRKTLPVLVVVAATLAAVPARAAAQGTGDDRVYRFLTADQLEDFLTSFQIPFKKTDDLTQRGVYYYDFKRGSFNVRLSYFDGKDLMIDNIFRKSASLDRINEWNKKAKFSRASLHKGNMGEHVMLEYNLDVLGGVTKGTVRQMITQFDTECKNFDRFLAGNVPPPAVPVAEKVLLPVTANALEKVLNDLNAQFKKNNNPNGVTAYDFEMDGFKLRLYNYNGKDLMVDATFRKVNLAALNKYNIDRKFVRAVAYNNNGNEYTSLETNLDCAAGVTEGMIRHFITAYVQDVRHFANYLNNLQP
jgi:Putative bacterial sensory transduction regulator